MGSRTGTCGLVGGWERYRALWDTSPPPSPLPPPLAAVAVCAPLVPLLTCRIGGGRGSVPGGQPGQLGAGVDAAFGGLGEVRVGAGEVAQVEHGAVAAGCPGPRWAGARAAGGEARRPSSELRTLAWFRDASWGTATPWLARTGLGQRLLVSPKRTRAPPAHSPPTYIGEAVLAPGFRLPGPLPFREAPALAP